MKGRHTSNAERLPDEPEPRVLHLTLTGRWFDLIASGKKTEEYREIKPYWIVRLEGKEFDLVKFSNGYGKDVPTVVCEWRGCRRARFKFQKKPVFVIQLGQVLETRNWDGGELGCEPQKYQPLGGSYEKASV